MEGAGISSNVTHNSCGVSTSSIQSSLRKAPSYRAAKLDPLSPLHFQGQRGQYDPYSYKESQSKLATKLSKNSTLPINVGNSPRQQISNTSTQIFSLNSSVSEPVCRICHGTSNTEQLMSLCYCAGSIGLMHVSCLQRWLGSSDKTQCELCHFNFAMERKPKPFYMYLSNPGTKGDRYRLVFDIVCLCLLSPSTLTVVSLCIYGASLYRPYRAEFVGLLALGILLLVLFTVWLMICLRMNIKKWKEWKQFNQRVKLKCSPPKDDNRCTQRSSEVGLQTTGKTSQMGVKISSIEIKVTTHGEDNKPFAASDDFQRKKPPEKRGMASVLRPIPPISYNSQYCRTDSSVVPETRQSPARSGEISREQCSGNYISSSSSSRESASLGQHKRRVTPVYHGVHHSRYLRTSSTEESRFPESLYSSSSRENGSQISSTPYNMSDTRARLSFPVQEVKAPGLHDFNSTIVYPEERYI
ncbi:E3 ubiquitin-protein ligase MARCHF8-like [Saccostrea echinata]|uniref:E3 ubiquitin-protein ligase MARCHF8-like n=1 Tax=Saccostrea echinata TaxID=191078 RepID=UPI002A80A2BC|nr:E3 ubiquitin-protein ligase MARCHF8-like [Saccostrea echinata]